MSDMTPYDKLTEQDLNLIQQYIDSYAASDSSNTYYAEFKPLNAVLYEWNKRKNEALFKLFGGELILRRLFTYKQTNTGLAREIEAHFYDAEPQAFSRWWNWSVKHNTNVKFEIEQASEVNGYFYSKFATIERAFHFECLAANAYDDEDFKVLFEDGTVFKVTRGMKPMKILHKFVEKYGTPEDEEMFEQYRIWHSRLLNQKTVDGELCLSIHPLDFMTMSDNNNGWTSCMRWCNKFGESDPGDYRAGTIECMNSPYIIIAYLHNPKHTFNPIKPDFEWNSKRWRELFIVNEGCIAEVKGYPYQEENLTNGCISWIKELAQKNMGWEYDDEEYNMRDPIQYEEDTFMLDFIKPDHMYKDIGTLPKHAGRINFDALRDKKKFHSYNYETLAYNHIFIEIPYGGIGTCVYCGKNLEPSRDGSVLCSSCEMMETCACCGDALGEDKYWIDDLDDYVCYDCYCDRCATDSFSEESHLAENMTTINLLLGYDESGDPIFYDGYYAECYEPDDNWYFQKAINGKLKYDYNRYYVTLDMANREEGENIFCDAFQIYPRSIDKLWSDCLDNYNLFYDSNMQPLWEEEESEDD